LACAESRIATAQVLRTYVGGKLVYQRGSGAGRPATSSKAKDLQR